MSFNYSNPWNVSMIMSDPTATQSYNLFKVPHAVDISQGIEGAFSIVDGEAANSSNNCSLDLDDGGATGNGTTSILSAAVGSSTGWDDLTPKALAGGTGSDLDANDYVNAVYTETGTVTNGGLGVHLLGVYGVPGAPA